jgi:hypothetical protein
LPHRSRWLPLVPQHPLALVATGEGHLRGASVRGWLRGWRDGSLRVEVPPLARQTPWHVGAAVAWPGRFHPQLLDKNRLDIGKSQSKHVAHTVETLAYRQRSQRAGAAARPASGSRWWRWRADDRRCRPRRRPRRTGCACSRWPTGWACQATTRRPAKTSTSVPADRARTAPSVLSQHARRARSAICAPPGTLPPKTESRACLETTSAAGRS